MKSSTPKFKLDRKSKIFLAGMYLLHHRGYELGVKPHFIFHQKGIKMARKLLNSGFRLDKDDFSKLIVWLHQRGHIEFIPLDN